jgi:hypothetical protein
MKDAVQMSSDGMIFIPNFIEIGSGVQKLLGGIHMQTHTESKVISKA